MEDMYLQAEEWDTPRQSWPWSLCYANKQLSKHTDLSMVSLYPSRKPQSP